MQSEADRVADAAAVMDGELKVLRHNRLAREPRVYIGPERRKGIDRRWNQERYPLNERRKVERRQEALTGTISGLTADQMQTLARLWQAHENATR